MSCNIHTIAQQQQTWLTGAEKVGEKSGVELMVAQLFSCNLQQLYTDDNDVIYRSLYVVRCT